MNKIKIFKLIISTLVISFYIPEIIFAKTLVYNNVFEGSETKTEIGITETDTGYLIIKTENEKDIHTFNTDEAYAILKWKYVNNDKQIDIVSERKDDKILVNGLFNGDQINKEIKINDMPWYQEWITGFAGFIKSGKESISFWTMDGSSMKRALKFSLNVEKSETLTINNGKCESVSTWLGPESRVIRLLWKGGKSWFRKSDGMCVQAKMNFSKNPGDILLLVGEK